MSASTVQTAYQRDTVHVGDVEIDLAPVTNQRYLEFVEATGHRSPAYWERGAFPRSMAGHPVVGVDFFDAIAFAFWAGGALPTELEWVIGTGLEEQRAYVWGDVFDASRCNTIRSEWKGTSPVGAHPGGTSPSGCMDMCGNVWEMTCNAYPTCGESIIVKGGSWYDYPGHARIDTEFGARVHRVGKTVGFRLIYGRPLRLPDFIDEELASQCIAFRRESCVEAAEELPESGEWNEAIDDLRREAEIHLATLPDSVELGQASLDEVLRFFDEADERPLEPSPPEVMRQRESPGVLARVHTYLETHPRTPLVFLGLAALAVVGTMLALVSGMPAERGQRTRDQLAKMSPPRRSAPVAPHADRPDTKLERLAASLDHTGDLVEALIFSDWAARESMERYLLTHASKDALKIHLRAPHLPDEVKASLRYVLAILDETGRSHPRKPTPIPVPPARGLVFFFKEMNGPVMEAISIVRRTARSVSLPVTAVYSGTGSGARVVKTYSTLLRNVRFYVDRHGVLAKRLGATGTPSVAGLRADGSVAFVRVGTVARSELAPLAARLARKGDGEQAPR